MEEAAPRCHVALPGGESGPRWGGGHSFPNTSRRRLPPDAMWPSPEESQARGGVAATPSQRLDGGGCPPRWGGGHSFPETGWRRLPPDATWPSLEGVRPEVTMYSGLSVHLQVPTYPHLWRPE
uniref:Uncharacterized protein n=1 Tax=Oryza sativa subsp. japonica TaxID=39947 RepID=Q69L98_ORYSJ|nr:hypothetical protein [Oryza sativa Japonica Group]